MVRIKSRPIRLRRPEPFAICAISIHEGCDKHLLRVLKPIVYYLNDWITIEGRDGSETATMNAKRQLDADWYGKRITIQAIVGKNGSGKSSLLDMMYRIVNNFGVALSVREGELKGSDDDNDKEPVAIKDDDEDNIYPAYISGIDASLYFVSGR